MEIRSGHYGTPIYDFDKQVGDTVWICNMYCVFKDSFIVTAIDSELTATGYRKALNLQAISSATLSPPRWVEGIGDIYNGLLYPEIPTVDGALELLCFKESATLIWDNGGGNCWLSGINENKPESFSVFPNPANNILTIDLKNEKVDKLKIYGIDGSLILSKKITGNKLPIFKEETGSGIFILQLCNDKATWHEKVVFY